MIAAIKKDNIMVEAITVSIIGAAVTTIIIDGINRNKPHKKTQEERMIELGVVLGVSVGMYFFTKRILK